MKRRLLTLAVVAGLISGAASLSAHHAWPVSYSKLVTVKGTVTALAWENPHPMISIDVRADNGTIEKWTIGGPALNRMEGSGWTRTTVKVGDVITGVGYQFADNQKIVRLEKVLLADGKELKVYGR